MSCLSCGRGFHDECEEQPCCCNNAIVDAEGSVSSTDEEREKRTRTSSNLRRTDVTVSAGRKRAAAEYELDPTAPCDWRGRANCGGGFIPVVGCLVGFQVARHHGPDKNTTNNSEENVHLICTACHNLWHRRNDPKYGEDKCPDGIKLHEPRWATQEELLTREPA